MPFSGLRPTLPLTPEERIGALADQATNATYSSLLMGEAEWGWLLLSLPMKVKSWLNKFMDLAHGL